MTTFSNWTFSITGEKGATGPSGASGATGPGAPLTSSATAPVSPSAGDLWFNTTTGASYIYYNSAWVELGGGSMSPMQTTSSARPAAPWEGQTIYDTDTNIGYQYDGTNFAPTYPGSGFRNVLINGDMRINQRGASYTSIGYTLDRWYLGVTGDYTVSQSTSTPPANFQNFMRVQRTNGSTNTAVPQIAHSLETSASIPLQGKQVTVSFYARAGANYSPTSSTLNYRIYGGTGTDQNIFSYTGQAIVNDLSVTLTTSWQRFTYTTSALTSYNEYGLFFFCNPTGTAGANDYFDITGVQLEANPQPTPFEQRPIGTELALCQRYYCVVASGSSFVSNAVMHTTTDFESVIHLPTVMRTAPTLVATTGASYYAIYALNVTKRVDLLTNASNNLSNLRIYGSLVSTTSTAGVGAGLYLQSASASIAASAEL